MQEVILKAIEALETKAGPFLATENERTIVVTYCDVTQLNIIISVKTNFVNNETSLKLSKEILSESSDKIGHKDCNCITVLLEANNEIHTLYSDDKFEFSYDEIETESL